MYIWSKSFQKAFADNFLFSAQKVSSLTLAMQLYRTRHEIFQLSSCQYSSFWYQKSFSFMMHQGVHVQFTSKVLLSDFEHNFFILKLHCLMLLLDLITSKHTFFREELSRHRNSISMQICLGLCKPCGRNFLRWNFLLVTSYQSLVASYQSLFTSYQSPLVASHQSLVTSHQLLQFLVNSYQSTSQQLLVTGQQKTSYQLEVTSYQYLA